MDVGNADGLIETIKTPDRWTAGVETIRGLDDNAPHWFALTGARSTAKPAMPNGYRAVVVRDYAAHIAGRTYTRPTLRVGYRRGDPIGVDVALVPPPGVERFSAGDQVNFSIELITLPRAASDYYGPNELFRQHLTSFPSSWKTTHRHAVQNALAVDVSGGELIRTYPIRVRTTSATTRMRIDGGVGAIPIEIEGIRSIAGLRLFDQSRQPLRYQIDPNPDGTFTLRFCLPSTPTNQTCFIQQQSSD